MADARGKSVCPASVGALALHMVRRRATTNLRLSALLNGNLGMVVIGRGGSRDVYRRAKGQHCSFEEQHGQKLTALNLACAERGGGLAFLGHVLGAVAAHGELLSVGDGAAERRLQVVQAVALLEGSLGLAVAGVGVPDLVAHLG